MKPLEFEVQLLWLAMQRERDSYNFPERAKDPKDRRTLRELCPVTDYDLSLCERLCRLEFDSG